MEHVQEEFDRGETIEAIAQGLVDSGVFPNIDSAKFAVAIEVGILDGDVIDTSEKALPDVPYWDRYP